jgi:hypothetical protein
VVGLVGDWDRFIVSRDVQGDFCHSDSMVDQGVQVAHEMCRSLVLCQDLTGSRDVQHELKVGFCEMQWSQCFSEVFDESIAA